MAKKKVIGASRPRRRQSRKEKLRARRDGRQARRARRCLCPGCNGSRVKTHWYAPTDQEQLDQVLCQKCGLFFNRQVGWIPGDDAEPMEAPQRRGGYRGNRDR